MYDRNDQPGAESALESRVSELVGLAARALEGVRDDLADELRATVDRLVVDARQQLAADVDREVARARAELAAVVAAMDQTLAHWHERIGRSSASLADAVESLSAGMTWNLDSVPATSGNGHHPGATW